MDAICSQCGLTGKVVDADYAYMCADPNCTGKMVLKESITEALAQHATRGAEAFAMNRPAPSQAVLGPDDPYVMYQNNFDNLFTLLKCSFGYIVPGEETVECVNPVTGLYMVFAYCEKHKGYPARWEALQERMQKS